MPAERRAVVFEAVNDKLSEVYVTWTFRPPFEAMAKVRKHLPAAIAHWKADREQIVLRTVECELAAESVAVAISRHVRNSLPDGWRYVLDAAARGR
jgi:hypothetical protein